MDEVEEEEFYMEVVFLVIVIVENCKLVFSLLSQLDLGSFFFVLFELLFLRSLEVIKREVYVESENVDNFKESEEIYEEVFSLVVYVDKVIKWDGISIISKLDGIFFGVQNKFIDKVSKGQLLICSLLVYIVVLK